MKASNKINQVVQIGRIMGSEEQKHCLEAFFGNALYWFRGIPAMKKYMTVKEVCSLTGLTRKHLYYFHHEKVVQAAAFSNYSVEGNTGYKLYDQRALEKLQQIALYYQFDLKRDEIRDIMLDPDYDSGKTLTRLLNIEQEKLVQIRRRIAALEYLAISGIEAGLGNAMCGPSVEELGRRLLEQREEALTEEKHRRLQDFMEQFNYLMKEYTRLSEEELASKGAALLKKGETLCHSCLGQDSDDFLLGWYLCLLGDGALRKSLLPRLTPAQGRFLVEYFMDRPAIDRSLRLEQQGENT